MGLFLHMHRRVDHFQTHNQVCKKVMFFEHFGIEGTFPLPNFYSTASLEQSHILTAESNWNYFLAG